MKHEIFITIDIAIPEKYRESIDNGYIFQPVALEVQGSLGESSEIFITRL